MCEPGVMENLAGCLGVLKAVTDSVSHVVALSTIGDGTPTSMPDHVVVLSRTLVDIMIPQATSASSSKQMKAVLRFSCECLPLQRSTALQVACDVTPQSNTPA